jgi:SPW repeat
MAHAHTMTSVRAGGQIRVASAINLILGLWLIIAAFSVAVSEAAYWNDLLVGIAVLILAGTRLSRPTEGTKPASWVNAAIGVWLIVAPFILRYQAAEEMWNDIIVGALLLIFAGWSASLPRERDKVHTRSTRTTPDMSVPPAGTAARRGGVDARRRR